jgi:hypothetical protein
MVGILRRSRQVPGSLPEVRCESVASMDHLDRPDPLLPDLPARSRWTDIRGIAPDSGPLPEVAGGHTARRRLAGRDPGDARSAATAIARIIVDEARGGHRVHDVAGKSSSGERYPGPPHRPAGFGSGPCSGAMGWARSRWEMARPVGSARETGAIDNPTITEAACLVGDGPSPLWCDRPGDQTTPGTARERPRRGRRRSPWRGEGLAPTRGSPTAWRDGVGQALAVGDPVRVPGRAAGRHGRGGRTRRRGREGPAPR